MPVDSRPGTAYAQGYGRLLNRDIARDDSGSRRTFEHKTPWGYTPDVTVLKILTSTWLANVLLGLSEGQLEAAQTAGELIEVESDGDDKEKGR